MLQCEGLYGNLIHLKPDLIVIDKSEMKVFVVKISTPLDAFITQCFKQSLTITYYYLVRLPWQPATDQLGNFAT